jgi:hypothetical protein
MMGASMIRSVQNVAVIRSYWDADPDACYEVVDEVVSEAGWTQNEDGTWTDPEWPEDASDPLEDLFSNNLPEKLENEILDSLEESYGKKHPKNLTVDSMESDFRSLPFVPDRRMADEYEEVKQFFVDSSGFGQPGEPALTFAQFMNAARSLIESRSAPTYFAITEAGQFQVYIGAYGHERYEEVENG